MTTWKETKEIIKKDIYRNCGQYSEKLYRKYKRKRSSTVALLIYFRKCNYYVNLPNKSIVQWIAHGMAYYRFQRLCSQCGIELNQRTKIGYGLRLPHKGTIIIHPQVVIGNNCEIMQGVTLGNNILKSRDLVPTIGDEVLLCAGAKVVGNVKIGNHVVVGANSVVTKDVENNKVIAGIPARMLRDCKDDFVINKC